MSYTWGHTFVDGDDLFEVGFLNRLIHAFDQRGLKSFISGNFDPITDGEDVGDYAFWLNMQFDSSFGAGGGAWQEAAVFWVEAVDWTGFDATPSLPVSDWPRIKAVALGGNGYTRKWPREFDTLASTTYRYDLEFYDLSTSTVYSDGSAFANGDYARNIDELGSGSVYQRVAGVWSGPVGHAPDKGKFVNGDLARNIADGIVYLRSGGAWVAQVNTKPDRLTAYGSIRPGDYIGPWLINEIRDAVNLLTAFYATIGTVTADGATNHYQGDSGYPEPDYATALADAQASYGPFAVENGVYPQARGDSLWDGATGWQVIMDRWKAKAQITDASDGLNSDYDFYSIAIAQDHGWNDNGDPVLESDPLTPTNILSKFDTQAGTGAGGTIKSAYLGNVTAAPVTVNPATASTDYNYGYQVTSMIYVRRLNVAGGYSEGPGLA